MKFYIPTKVFAEKDCVKNHAADLALLGSCALIVTGRHSAKACGALDDVESVLQKNHQRWTVFDEVEENPSCETVVKGRDQGLAAGADFVIAIGGGSPMDAGKAMALMMAQRDMTMEDLYRKSSSYHVLPIAAIPTTCGTGSEVTGVSVLTNHQTKSKGSIPYKLFPNLALLDAGYLSSLSHRKICDTAVDALAHLMESGLNSAADDFSRLFVKEGLEAWGNSKAVLAGEKEAEEQDYFHLLYTSALGGMAIAHTGTSIPHAMSYAATYLEHVSHGRACGYYLTGFLRECGENGQLLLPQLAGFSGIDELDEFIFRICDMTVDEISAALRMETAEKMASNTAKLKTSCVPMSSDMLRRIARV